VASAFWKQHKRLPMTVAFSSKGGLAFKEKEWKTPLSVFEFGIAGMFWFWFWFAVSFDTLL